MAPTGVDGVGGCVGDGLVVVIIVVVVGLAAGVVMGPVNVVVESLVIFGFRVGLL